MATLTATAGKPTPRARTKKQRRASMAGKQLTAGPLTYVALILVAAVAVFPLYWTFVEASHTNAQIALTPPPFAPNGSIFHNANLARHQASIGKAIFNSVVISGTVMVATVLCCTLAGFAFAKLKFRGNKGLLALVIGTMMVPPQLGIIPLYLLIAKLHLVNHIAAVILPTLVSAFGVFFMRQFLSQAMPTELLEAGWVDGASTFRIFWSIVIPIARPAMAVLGMLTFLASWNDFLWPLIVMTSRNPTAQVAIAGIGTGYSPQQSIIMAGILLVTLPVLVVFALLGKQIVGGIMQGAVKG
jgi:cellobiose transport system permease protein